MKKNLLSMLALSLSILSISNIPCAAMKSDNPLPSYGTFSGDSLTSEELANAMLQDDFVFMEQLKLKNATNEDLKKLADYARDKDNIANDANDDEPNIAPRSFMLQGLDLSECRAITNDGLIHLTTINSAGKNRFPRKAGLKYLNLKRTGINSTQASGISALASLTDLQTLILSYTRVEKIDALASLINLERLELIDTPVSDISALARLSNLQNLGLGYSKVEKIDALEGLINLRMLGLRFTKVSNLTPIAQLKYLQMVDLANTPVKDISPLANATNLTGIDLSNTPVKDVSPLANATKLELVDFSNTPIKDLSPLAKATKLKKLLLLGAKDADIDPLDDLQRNGLEIEFQ